MAASDPARSRFRVIKNDEHTLTTSQPRIAEPVVAGYELDPDAVVGIASEHQMFADPEPVVGGIAYNAYGAQESELRRIARMMRREHRMSTPTSPSSAGGSGQPGWSDFMNFQRETREQLDRTARENREHADRIALETRDAIDRWARESRETAQRDRSEVLAAVAASTESLRAETARIESRLDALALTVDKNDREILKAQTAVQVWTRVLAVAVTILGLIIGIAGVVVSYQQS